MRMSKKTILFALLTLFLTVGIAQTKTTNPYRAERTKINDLVHTKLKVSFNFAKSQMNGEAWITLEPHFYPTNQVVLDAKAMLIDNVSKDGVALKYTYKKNKLTIALGNTYAKGEKYTVYIKYIARPEEVKQKGSKAITDAKGLYFIDPTETDPDKPTQIWTQGETEANSVWFPTLDTPNQKSTEEIYMTVPSKFVTLSNGILVSQTPNADGTRTDYWKMDLPHAPYLFFMGVGEYEIVKDSWKGRDVNYYVSKKYAPYAKQIFGLTPEMIQFFSDRLGVEYAWPKYDQIVGTDYVSGAMENTTAVLHQESAYQVPGQLIDENRWEDVISHELFHHWFGDLVTTESWSNLTVNESFANYSEYLWREYKYGKDHADAQRYKDLQGYFNSKSESKNLVRFHYGDKEDMFDAVTYNKGGYILHMLRNYLGDDAFFAGLKKYLDDNKFGTGEAQQLRLALEAVSGKDLNWFFNQWYYGSGHIKLDVSYKYDASTKKVSLHLKQNDKTFSFPLKIDVYTANGVKHYDLWIDKEKRDLSFTTDSAPLLIDVDPEKDLLMQVTDTSKTVAQYSYQYKHVKSYEARRKAIAVLGKHQDDKEAYATLTTALNDRYFGLREMALGIIDLDKSDKKVIKTIEKLAKNDPKTLVQASAINALSSLKDKRFKKLFINATQSLSFSVQSEAISALYDIDKEIALAKARALSDESKKYMADNLVEMFIKEKDVSQMPYIAKHLIAGMFFTQDKDVQKTFKEAFKWVAGSTNKEAIQVMIDNFVKVGKQYKKYGADKMMLQMMTQVISLQKESKGSNNAELIDIVNKGVAKLKE
jgi:aminopeptidase N